MGAASFKCVWQPATCKGVIASQLPFKVNVPRKPNMQPVDWAVYPETGIYLYAECLVADMYLGNLRPTLNTSAEAEINSTYVAQFLFLVKDSVSRALSANNMPPALRPYMQVAQACLDYLASVVQKPPVGKVAVMPENALKGFLGKVSAAVPTSSRDLAKLVPPRCLMVCFSFRGYFFKHLGKLFIMRVMFLPVVWITRIFRKRKPIVQTASAELCAVQSLPSTAVGGIAPVAVAAPVPGPVIAPVAGPASKASSLVFMFCFLFLFLF